MLNKFIKPPHFKLEDINIAFNMIDKNSFMSTLDLKDAYFVVPIWERQKIFKI